MKDPRKMEIAYRILELESKSINDLAQYLDDSFFRSVEIILKCTGMLYTSGVGSSGIVAMRFAHLITCCGTPAFFIHPVEALHGHAGVLRNQDVLFAISKGGRSDEMNALVKLAREKGVFVLSLTENSDSPICEMSDIALIVKSREETGVLKYVAPVSSVAHAALCDVICTLVLQEKGIDEKYIEAIHPGGEVGKTLRGK
jgi:arabinose-5-phosphate isomerase